MKNSCNYCFGIFITIAALFGCNHSNYKIAPSGLHYKFIAENQENKKPEVGDIVSINMRYWDEKGKEIEATDLFRTQLKKPSHPGGSIEDALAMMHKGDSALFQIKAEDFYTQTRKVKVPGTINPDDMLTFSIKLLDVMTFDDFEKERHNARISNQRDEDRLLEDFLKRTNVNVEPTASGMYYVELRKGDGPAPVPGKKVTVNYLGYFIDGQIFDSSYERHKPFTFTLGVGEVIPGWEEGIAKMHKGGKAKLIIPSSLAYGDKQAGPVPPYASLIFEVELVDVQQ